MRILLEISLFFKRRLLETVRQTAWVVSDLMTPLLYIALFSPLLKNLSSPPLSTAAALDSFVPGILTLLAFNSGMGAGWSVVQDLQSGVIERLRVSPASRFSILMGQVLTDITAFLAQAAVVLIICACFGFNVHIGGLAVLLVLLCALTASVSAWSGSLGLILKQVGSLAAVVTSLQLPLMLLSGVLLPISLGPGWLRVLAHLNPLYYTVEASRTLSTGAVSGAETLLAFAVILPLAALTLWWATGVYCKAVA